MKAAIIALTLLAGPVQALNLSLPNATLVTTETDPAGSLRLPDAPWSPGVAASVVDGAIRQEVLRLPSASATTLQLLSGLRDVLQEEGYDEVFACADEMCGGFDFRFQLDIIGEPDMHVDLGDFRYVLFRAADAETDPHTVALLASRSRTAGFVQISYVSEAAPGLGSGNPVEQTSQPVASGGLIERLVGNGHAVLRDLDFGTGTSDLGPGPFGSLEDLATWLEANPSARILLVGHTDSVGSLEANTALSRRRAQSVVSFLVTRLGADAGRIAAAGAGYLSPIASNLTDEGRAENRRVEVVLLSAD